MTKKTEMNTIEQYSVWYFQDLKEKGYLIDYIREPETLCCADKYKRKYLKRLKKLPNRMEEFNLFPDVNYTYDYKLIWNPNARYLFYDLVDKDDPDSYFKYGRPPFIANYDYEIDENTYKQIEVHITRIDVKPTTSVMRFGKTSSSLTFPFKQRLLFDRDGTFVQKFVPIPMAGTGKTSAMFVKTFTPKRYLFTDGGKQLRKIKWAITDLNGFVHLREKIIADMDKIG